MVKTLETVTKRFADASGGKGETAWGQERTDKKEGFLQPFKRDGETMVHKTLSSATAGVGGFLAQLRLNLGGDEELSKPYLQSPWVHSCIKAIARGTLK